MKRIISLFLVLVMCLSLCACGEKEPEFDPEAEFESEVNADVAVKCMFSYADVKSASTNLADISVSSDGVTYTGKGKVTIRDNYGDTYVGKVTAVYSYDADTQSFSKQSLDIETPKKQ